MANPRYQPREPRKSSQEKKLGTLAALQQLSNQGAAPQMQQQQLQQNAQQDRQRAVLGFMQMMQEAQQSQQRNALGERGLQQQGADLQGQNSRAELGALVEMMRGGDKVAGKALQGQIPSYGQAQGQVEEERVQGLLPEAMQKVGAIYSGGKDIPNMLNQMQPTIDPKVWDRLPWGQYNGGMQAPAPVGPRQPSLMDGFKPNNEALRNDTQAQTPLFSGIEQREGGRRNPLVEFIYRLVASRQTPPIPALNNLDVNPQDFGYPN